MMSFNFEKHLADDFHNPWNVSVEDTAKCTSHKFKDLKAFCLEIFVFCFTHGEASAKLIAQGVTDRICG